MSTFCYRKLICQATKNEMSCLSRYFGLLLAQAMKKATLPQIRMISFATRVPTTVHMRVFSSGEEAEEEEITERKKKKANPHERPTFGNVGRKIPYRLIHVISESGEDLGTMHRANVIRLMDEHGLKLVPVRENADPPVYQLLTGKQIHEEQIKRREMQKAKSKTAGNVQIKELTFSAAIAKHDLETKRKQIQQWIEKKHHVRITVQKGNADDGTEKLQILDQIVDSIPEKATFVFKPKLIKEGKAAMCVLRHLSEKELHEYRLKKRESLKEEGGIAEAALSKMLKKGEEVN